MHDLTPKRDQTRDQQEVDEGGVLRNEGFDNVCLGNRCVRQRILEKIPNSMSFSASLSGNRVNRLQGRVGKGQEPHRKRRKHKREFHQETKKETGIPMMMAVGMMMGEDEDDGNDEDERW